MSLNILVNCGYDGNGEENGWFSVWTAISIFHKLLSVITFVGVCTLVFHQHLSASALIKHSPTTQRSVSRPRTKRNSSRKNACTFVRGNIKFDFLGVTLVRLTHWGREGMAAISQKTFSSAFSWMEIYEFRLKFQWDLFLRVQSTIFQPCLG